MKRPLSAGVGSSLQATGLAGDRFSGLVQRIDSFRARRRFDLRRRSDVQLTPARAA